MNDIDEFVQALEQNPIIGTALGKGLYKIRLKSRDKQTGKRGGFRVIYYLEFQENIYLIKIYSKNIDDNFVRKEIEKISSQIPFNPIPAFGTQLDIQIRLQRPVIDISRCIGCGVCEHECPVRGKRAIRVSAENESRHREHALLLNR